MLFCAQQLRSSGVIILLSVGALRLVLAVSLLIVPPTPSHGILPCDVAKSYAQLSSYDRENRRLS